MRHGLRAAVPPGMASIYRRVLGVLAGSTQNQLRQQIQYLKAENQVLRSRIDGPVRVTARERARLVRLALPLGVAILALVSIVQPKTIQRWLREARKHTRPRRHKRRRPGRPRTPEDIRAVILRIAEETGWGYTRILGELKKLGITVSRSTVVNILREAGLPTGPDRSEPTWNEFIRAHAQTLWACDFLRHRILTSRGFRDAYLLVFIHIASRRMVATGSTLHPDAGWVAARTREFAGAEAQEGARLLLRDRDTKFGAAFDEALDDHGMAPVRLPHCAPNLNAYAERLIQSVQQECLDRFVVMGTRHLDYLVSEYARHYNTERPHSGIGYKRPGARDGPASGEGKGGRVVCRTRLGGVLRHYRRAG